MTDKGPKGQVITSLSEQERVEKLGVYFRAFLHNWFEGLVEGVRFSHGVSRELATALLEYGAAAALAASDASMAESDEVTAKRCQAAVAEMFAVLEREWLS